VVTVYNHPELLVWCFIPAWHTFNAVDAAVILRYQKLYFFIIVKKIFRILKIFFTIMNISNFGAFLQEQF